MSEGLFVTGFQRNAIKLQAVPDQPHAVFLRDFFLQTLDFLILEFDDPDG